MRKLFVLLTSVILISTSCSSSTAQDNVEQYTITKKPCPRSKVNQEQGNKICIKTGKVYRWANKIKTTPVVEITPETKNSSDDKTQEKVDTSGISLNFIISENALKRNYERYLSALNNSVEFWYPVFNKSTVNVILFTEQDSAWIDETQKKLMGNFFYRPEYDFQSYRLKQYGCNIGGFYLPNIILACVNESYSTLEASMIMAHEYVHLVGMTSLQLSNYPLGSMGRMRPCWVEEGMAVFYGMKSASTVDKDFEINKEKFLKGLSFRITSNLKSQQSITSTMSELEKDMTSCNKVKDAYFLGSKAVEKLYNEHGHTNVLEFNKLFYKGVPWKTAFYNTFKISVNEFYDKLAIDIVKD